MKNKFDTEVSTSKTTETAVFKSARRDMTLELKMALADAQTRISERPNSGFKPAGSNCSRIFVKSVRKHAQLLVLFSYFDDLDHVYFLDAHLFFGDPVELKKELKWLGSELVCYEKQTGVELLVELQNYDEE